MFKIISRPCTQSNLSYISASIAEKRDLEQFSKIMVDGACLGYVHYVLMRINQLLLISDYSQIPDIIVHELTTNDSHIPESYFKIFKSVFFQEILSISDNQSGLLKKTIPAKYVFGLCADSIILNADILNQKSSIVKKETIELIRFITLIDQHSMEKNRWRYICTAIVYANPESLLIEMWEGTSIQDWMQKCAIQLGIGGKLAFNVITEGQIIRKVRRHLITFHLFKLPRDSVLIHFFDPNMVLLQAEVKTYEIKKFYQMIYEQLAKFYSNYIPVWSLLTLYSQE